MRCKITHYVTASLLNPIQCLSRTHDMYIVWVTSLDLPCNEVDCGTSCFAFRITGPFVRRIHRSPVYSSPERSIGWTNGPVTDDHLFRGLVLVNWLPKFSDLQNRLPRYGSNQTIAPKFIEIILNNWIKEFLWSRNEPINNRNQTKSRPYYCRITRCCQNEKKNENEC